MKEQTSPAETVSYERLLGCWTRQALNAGARLTIEPVMKGKSIFRARMEWPHGENICGEIGLGAESALEQLEAALLEDAAKEMQESGAV